MKVKIYVLKDPNTKLIRYVGRTSKKRVKDRLAEHISKAKYHKRYKRRTTPIVNWINKLLKEEKIPIIEVIDIVYGWEKSHQEERRYIKYYKQYFNLTNLDDRGAGGYNKTVDSKTRKNISETLKNHYKNGMKNAGYEKLRKPVYQFDKEGNFIKKHLSIAIASHELNIHNVLISTNCLGRSKSTKGFVFSFKPEFPKGSLINNHLTPINIINIKTNEIFKFKSIIECINTLNISKSSMYRMLKNNNKIYKKIYKVYDKK